jgi:hypothetical protein
MLADILCGVKKPIGDLLEMAELWQVTFKILKGCHKAKYIITCGEDSSGLESQGGACSPSR